METNPLVTKETSHRAAPVRAERWVSVPMDLWPLFGEVMRMWSVDLIKAGEVPGRELYMMRDRKIRVLTTTTAAEPIEALTPREQEVLEGIARGEANADIAARLYLATDTVKTHVGKMMRKLRVGDRSAAVTQGFIHGLLSPEDFR